MKEETKKVWSMDKTLVGMEESAEAVIRKCSVNKTFWKISQNSQKIPVLESIFNEVSGLENCSYIEKLLLQRWLQQRILRTFYEHLFCRISANGSFWINVFGVYIPFWSPFRGGGRVWKLFEDNPSVFWRVICTCEGRYYKINYKYEKCKLTKTKAYCKNISF